MYVCDVRAWPCVCDVRDALWQPISICSLSLSLYLLLSLVCGRSPTVAQVPKFLHTYIGRRTVQMQTHAVKRRRYARATDCCWTTYTRTVHTRHAVDWIWRFLERFIFYVARRNSSNLVCQVAVWLRVCSQKHPHSIFVCRSTTIKIDETHTVWAGSEPSMCITHGHTSHTRSLNVSEALRIILMNNLLIVCGEKLSALCMLFEIEEEFLRECCCFSR